MRLGGRLVLRPAAGRFGRRGGQRRGGLHPLFACIGLDGPWHGGSWRGGSAPVLVSEGFESRHFYGLEVGIWFPEVHDLPGRAVFAGPRLQDSGATHLYANFGTNPAAVACLMGVLYVYPYSFTVHGLGEFDKPGALMLGDMINDTAFVVGGSSFGTG
jgi:hypothetical protein